MASLPPLTPIINGTPADASEVHGNFDTLATFVDSELINRDGSVAMTEELTLSSNTPSTDLVAASKGYVDTEIAAFVASPALGVMGYATSTANQTGIGSTLTDITDMSVTFTAVAGRLYKATFSGVLQAETHPSVIQLSIADGGTVLGRQAWQLYDHGGALVDTSGFCVVCYFTATGSKTIKARGQASAGDTFRILSASPAHGRFFIIEDIGAA